MTCKFLFCFIWSILIFINWWILKCMKIYIFMHTFTFNVYVCMCNCPILLLSLVFHSNMEITFSWYSLGHFTYCKQLHPRFHFYPKKLNCYYLFKFWNNNIIEVFNDWILNTLLRYVLSLSAVVYEY